MGTVYRLHIHLSRPDPPNPAHQAAMEKYVDLLRKHTWITEGATGAGFHYPGAIGGGILAHCGINACVHELNVEWIAGLDDCPSARAIDRRRIARSVF